MDKWHEEVWYYSSRVDLLITHDDTNKKTSHGRP